MKEEYIKQFKKIMLANPSMNFKASATASSFLLFSDYLTNLKRCKLTMGIDFFFINNTTFHNLFLDISPAWANEMLPIDSFFETVVKKECVNYNLSNWLFNSLLIYLFVSWEVFKNKDELKKISEVENPYSSAIKIIEGNHLISLLEGHFHIGETIYLKKGQNKLQLPSTNIDFLNFIDDKYLIKPYSIIKIPNQSEVDTIWKEFNIV